MRPDMAKVIVERPRSGHSHGFIPHGKRRLLTDDDGEPIGFFASDHTRTKKTKWFNENLAPLRRYLETQSGRPWNDVRSEISAHLRPSSTVQQHVIDHIADFVAVTTWRDGADVWTMGRWRGPTRLVDSRQRLYVDPDTGRLARNPYIVGRRSARHAATARAEAEVAARRRILSLTCPWHRLDNGLWFEVTLAPARCELLRRSHETIAMTDGRDVVLMAGLSRLTRAELYGRHGVLAVAKRQLSRRELRKAGVR
ncbi:MAG: hypothetical protein K2Y05_06705 [Hyphomicrobiaceae bacterium]|nr:hypothetical protein [Hyphomicrobiaceae bacterium]